MVEIHAPGATEPARRLLADALLQTVAGAVTSDPRIGGAVDGATVQPAAVEDSTTEGAAPLRSAALPITLIFTAAHPHA